VLRAWLAAVLLVWLAAVLLAWFAAVLLAWQLRSPMTSWDAPWSLLLQFTFNVYGSEQIISTLVTLMLLGYKAEIGSDVDFIWIITLYSRIFVAETVWSLCCFKQLLKSRSDTLSISLPV